jgi:selenide,water dikinase
VNSALKEKDIKVLHDCQVERLSKDTVFLKNGNMVNFTHAIWATGAEAHPLAKQVLPQRGLEVCNRGWIKVGPTLESLSIPGVFAAGDCATIINGSVKSPPKAGNFLFDFRIFTPPIILLMPQFRYF